MQYTINEYTMMHKDEFLNKDRGPRSVSTNINNSLINLEGAPKHKRRTIILQAVYNELCKIFDSGKPSFAPQKGKPSVILFVGLQGSGKTTTCTKYAYHHQKMGWKPALVCADTSRAGAFDQLKQNATRAKWNHGGVPKSYTESDPVKIAVDGVEMFKKENCDLIIVDTSGCHKQEAALFEEVQQVSEATKPDLVIFVIDSTIGQAAFDQVQAFQQGVALGAVILTKMDGHPKGGGALIACSKLAPSRVVTGIKAWDVQSCYYGNGPNMYDFEVFDVEPFVNGLIGMDHLSGLATTTWDTVSMDPELFLKYSKGQFTLRIMYEQLQKALKRDPLGQVEKECQFEYKRYVTMMESMTDEGNPKPKIMTASRVMDIAKASGCLVHEVMEMLERYKCFTVITSNMKDRQQMSCRSRNMNAQKIPIDC
ncbi:Signal recognition particle 54 kDa protein 2 [Capsicum annuum]|nr:Signal recognition particle 54 kDa protein 2 [Capsicum annuum]KAF3642227.1 Signal recognition particle 54 kDa protein 2 [Capsicum annuum]